MVSEALTYLGKVLALHHGFSVAGAFSIARKTKHTDRINSVPVNQAEMLSSPHTCKRSRVAPASHSHVYPSSQIMNLSATSTERRTSDMGPRCWSDQVKPLLRLFWVCLQLSASALCLAKVRSQTRRIAVHAQQGADKPCARK